MDCEPLTKWGAHPSIVRIKEAKPYLHRTIGDGFTIISRFPALSALLSMTLYDWGLLFIKAMYSTRWCPPSYKLVHNPNNYIYI